MPKVTQVNSTIWTPEGEVWQKDVIHINRMELQTLARMHEIAHKYGIALVCQKCDHSITGSNNDQTQEPAVRCSCREWRYVGG